MWGTIGEEVSGADGEWSPQAGAPTGRPMAGRVTASVDAAHDPMLDAFDWPSQLLYLKVLRRPLEPKLHPSIAVVHELADVGAGMKCLLQGIQCQVAAK